MLFHIFTFITYFEFYRRSSFTAFCKKAANAGRSRRSSTNSLVKSSMSTSDDDMIPMQDLQIQVPIIVTKSSIPIITLTEPDSEPFNEDDLDESDAQSNDHMTSTDPKEPEVKVNLPEIAVSPPSPRPCRKDLTQDHFTEEEEEEEPEMPQIQITIESPSSISEKEDDKVASGSGEQSSPESSSAVPIPGPVTSSKQAVTSFPGPVTSSKQAVTTTARVRHKPPPISIPNSNFLNFKNESNNTSISGKDSEVKIGNGNGNSIMTTNVPKDAMSKPEHSSRVPIELGERRSKAPNVEQHHANEKHTVSAAAVKVCSLLKMALFERVWLLFNVLNCEDNQQLYKA